ncbi:MAG: sulfur carrier protein ThiS [Phycisphaerales bacterium JB037]|jgi:sulfur carrier protein
MIRIILNGEERPFTTGQTVADLLREVGLASLPCAVEVNGEVVPKRSHPEQTLAEGDRIELVTLVGGG